MTPSPDAELYARRVIDAYLRLPDTPRRARPQDRELAAQLHQRGVPETIVHAAFQLATLRRIDRPDGAAPLNPIRSLHYFMPVIEELLQARPSAGYLTYLRRSFHDTVQSAPGDHGSEKIVFT